MPTKVRFFVTAIFAIAVALLSLFVLGTLGLGTVPYVEFPLALFITTLAIWPVAVKLLGIAERQRFADWATFDAAFTLLFGLILWSITAWHTTSPLLDELTR